MYVIGTAGHIDHGKSTLVKALTGIDPDRLREEKERGMTIDLGFAWLRLPSGREVSVVDVPGHERFIKNMLAGVGGIDLALLVIAADEGVMPQTEEHLSILEILRVKRAVVALTKRDLVDADWLELVLADAEERLSRSTLRGSPIVAVSSTTGEGLPELLAILDESLDHSVPKASRGRPRVPIDRVFTMSGFGTVITGTLIDGELDVGQELEIQPGEIKTKARGIQSHKHKVDRALPGSRVAVNVTGVGVSDLQRGQVLTTAGWLRPTKVVDARLVSLAQAPPIAHNAPVSFHAGSAEVMARVRLLDADVLPPGQEAWAQLQLVEPVAVAKGDLFVIRSPNETLGGGEIVETHPRRHRRREEEVLDRLQVFEHGSASEVVLQAVDSRLGAEVGEVAERSGLTAEESRAILRTLTDESRVRRLGDRYLSPGAYQALQTKLVAELTEFHARFPLRDGLPREEVKSRLRLAPRDASTLLDDLAQRSVVVLDEAVVRLPEHQVRFTSEQERQIGRLLDALSAQPFTPPALDELARGEGLDDEVLAALSGQGRIIRVSDTIGFTADAFAEVRRRIVDRLVEVGSISVAEVRDLLDTSRKYSLAIMEYLDQQRLTRRVGDTRVLR